MKCVAILALLASCARAQYVCGEGNYDTDTNDIINPYWWNDTWLIGRVPLFQTTVKDIQDIYYYRWNVLRVNQRDLGADRYITTEYLEEVPWQSDPRGILLNAANFHLRELRWLWDPVQWKQYIKNILERDPDLFQVSESLADALWQVYLVDGKPGTVTRYLDTLIDNYEGWTQGSSPNAGYDASKGLFWIEPRTDGTEYTIASIDASGGSDGLEGGDAFRPSFNAYQYANALAISKLSAIRGFTADADKYKAKADALKARVQDDLWNGELSHFTDRYKADNENVTYWDFVRGRELTGYVPWTHNLPDDNATFAQAWKHLLNSAGFAGSHGLRTTEPSYEHYMKQFRYDSETNTPERQWNGPTWAYQTSQVLMAMANLLHDYPETAKAAGITKADYHKLLLQYAQLHNNPSYGDARVIEESYDPETGEPIVDLARSPHHYGSSYTDLIITGFAGLRPRADNILEINPLADPEQVDAFYLHYIPYHGRRIDIVWDKTGKHYDRQPQGFTVLVDCKRVAHSPTLTRIQTNLTRSDPPDYMEHYQAESVRVYPTAEYPKGSTSDPHADQTSVNQVIDGRTSYFQERPHGWITPVATNGSEMWYQIDFGKPTTIGMIEVAFGGDPEKGIAAPSEWTRRVQLANGTWIDPMGLYTWFIIDWSNWADLGLWEPMEVLKARVIFRPKPETRAQIVEVTAYRDGGYFGS